LPESLVAELALAFVFHLFSHISAGGSPLVLVGASCSLPSPPAGPVQSSRPSGGTSLGFFSFLPQYVVSLHTGHIPLILQCLRSVFLPSIPFAGFSFSIQAFSTRPRPLKRIAHPETLSIEILPRSQTDNYNVFNRRSRSLDSPDLLHSDSFRLTLSAFGQTFYLHLRPNDHLIHPAARINYFSTTPDGQTVLTRTEPLLRESVKAYYGDVVPSHLSSERLRLDAASVVPDSRNRIGWARIMVHHQGDSNTQTPPVFEGAFTAYGVTHHISTSDNYLRNKQRLDPEIVDLTHSDLGLVIWRDSDVLPHHEEVELRLKHGFPPKFSPLEPPSSCGHDDLIHNTDPFENPALRKPQLSSSWYDPFNVLDAYTISPNVSSYKRDDVAGNGMNTTKSVLQPITVTSCLKFSLQLRQ
jgi:hypothetical protein